MDEKLYQVVEGLKELSEKLDDLKLSWRLERLDDKLVAVAQNVVAGAIDVRDSGSWAVKRGVTALLYPLWLLVLLLAALVLTNPRTLFYLSSFIQAWR
jgi:hypothetical protein